MELQCPGQLPHVDCHVGPTLPGSNFSIWGNKLIVSHWKETIYYRTVVMVLLASLQTRANGRLGAGITLRVKPFHQKHLESSRRTGYSPPTDLPRPMALKEVLFSVATC